MASSSLSADPFGLVMGLAADSVRQAAAVVQSGGEC